MQNSEYTGNNGVGLQLFSMGFALLGVVVLVWVAFASGGKEKPAPLSTSTTDVAAPEAVQPVPVAADDSISAPPAPPSSAEQELKTEAPAQLPDAELKKTVVPMPPLDGGYAEPKATAGAGAIVRWTLPTAEGLELLENGRAAEALAWAKGNRERLAAGGPGAQVCGVLLEARALIALNRWAEAKVLFEKAGSAGAANDAALGAALCDAQGAWDSVPVQTLQACAEAPEAGWGAATASYGLAQRLEHSQEAKGKNEELARTLYQRALLSNALELPLEKACLARLEALTETIVLNPRRYHLLGEPKAEFHKVAPGDSFYKIAKQYGVAVGHIATMNRLDPKKFLNVGQVLKILPGETVMRVDRQRLTGTLLVGGVFVRRFFVGIGPGDATPRGTYKVSTKLANPDWYYNGRRIPFGDPENILGTRWMGFDPQSNAGKGAGLGVHGTGLPQSVPGRESKGCVRMLNADVEWLYEWMPHGAAVEVVN